MNLTLWLVSVRIYFRLLVLKSLVSLLIASVPIIFTPLAFGSEVSDTFQLKLEKACLELESSDVCSCYAKSVTERYNDAQLITIFELLRDKEANKMFLVVHEEYGRACGSFD